MDHTSTTVAVVTCVVPAAVMALRIVLAYLVISRPPGKALGRSQDPEGPQSTSTESVPTPGTNSPG